MVAARAHESVGASGGDLVLQVARLVEHGASGEITVLVVHQHDVVVVLVVAEQKYVANVGRDRLVHSVAWHDHPACVATDFDRLTGG